MFPARAGCWLIGLFGVVGACGGGSSSGDSYAVIGVVELTAGMRANDCVIYVQGTPLGARCDEDGVFRIQGLPGGQWMAEIAPAAELATMVARLRVPFAAQIGDTVDLGTLVLSSPGAVTGRATPEDELTEPGSVVLVPGTSAIAATENGLYLLPAVPPGMRAALLITDDGSVRREGVAVTPAALTRDIDFDVGGRIFGQSEVVGKVEVVGRSSAAVTVELVNRVNGTVVDSVHPEGGSFQMPAHPGAFIVRASLAGDTHPAIIDIAVEANQRVDVGTLYVFVDTDNDTTFAPFFNDDLDGDGVPDFMDPSATAYIEPVSDTDSDGFLDPIDNCPLVANPAQADEDNDGTGDPCDVPGAVGGVMQYDTRCDGNVLIANVSTIFDGSGCDGPDHLFIYFSDISPKLANPIGILNAHVVDSNGPMQILVKIYSAAAPSMSGPSNTEEADTFLESFGYYAIFDVTVPASYAFNVSSGIKSFMEAHQSWDASYDLIFMISPYTLGEATLSNIELTVYNGTP